MKICMISGSPRKKGSNSMYILSQLKEMFDGKNSITLFSSDIFVNKEHNMADAFDCDALIIAFPLYVDGIPSNLLEFMEQAESFFLDNSSKINHPVLNVIVNNGFYDARQNRIAIEMAFLWGKKLGLQRGSGLGVGAGEMMQFAKIGQGPMHNLGVELTKFVQSIMDERDFETRFVEPNFPRILYILSAHMGWGKMAAQNGLKKKDIKGTLSISK